MMPQPPNLCPQPLSRQFPFISDTTPTPQPSTSKQNREDKGGGIRTTDALPKVFCPKWLGGWGLSPKSYEYQRDAWPQPLPLGWGRLTGWGKP
jgi:hypothetical protein